MDFAEVKEAKEKPLKIAITSRIECTDDLREYVQRRLAFALSRFADRVQSVDVLLDDVNGPRGGVDQRCRLIVGLKREAEPVVSDTTHEDMRAAIDLSAGRAGRTVARTLDRKVKRRNQAPARS